MCHKTKTKTGDLTPIAAW